MTPFDLRSVSAHALSPSIPDLGHAIEDNLADYWMALASTPGGKIHTSDDLCWTYTGTEYFNRVVSAHLDPDQVDRVARSLRATFRQRQAAVTWLVGPSTTPHDIGRRLQRLGFVSYGRWTGMARDLRAPDVVPLPRVATDVRRVDSAETLRDWVEVVCSSFQMPRRACVFLYRYFLNHLQVPSTPWSHHLAYLDGRPVAASTIFARHGVAGIYLVSSVPEIRGNGLGTKMTRVALRHARRAGNELAVLHATGEGENIYERLGFRPYCDIGIYRLAPPRPLWRRLGRRIVNHIDGRVAPA
jgi:GNAT superfamily N-acetyltransferase